MKIKYRVILILMALALMISSTIYIYALLTHTISKAPIEYKIGDMDLSVSGELKSSYIYPGENLVIEDFVITNNSTIDIEIRIILEFYLIDLDEAVDIFEYTETFDFNSDSEWNKTGEYYYYDDVITSEDDEIILFKELVLDGHVVKNMYNNEDFKIKLIIQAKQKEHVDWLTLGDKFIH